MYIIPRSDDESPAVKVSGVNKLLKTFCNQNGWEFVDHSNVSPEHGLNRSGLHLNAKGTARLAANFITYWRGDYGIADWETNESLPPRINRKYTNNKGNQSTINPFGRGFVMAAVNINSLLAHFDDLKFFLLNSKIDVLVINETKINSSVNDNEIHLPGFEVVRKDLVFMTLKICYERTGIHRTIESRVFKILTTTTSSTMLHNSQRQIQKRCGMFGKNYLWK